VQDCWLPTPLACFPFTSPPVRHRVPPDSACALQHTILPVAFTPAPSYQCKPAKCPYCHCHIYSLMWTEQLDDWKIYNRDAEQLTGDVQVVDAWDFGLHHWLQHGDLCNCSSENQFSAVLFATVCNTVVTVPPCCQFLCHWCVSVCVFSLHLGCK